MKLDTFFEKFELFADAPNAVAKMRELIVHLAIRGKVVPNDPREKAVGLKLARPLEEGEALPANWSAGVLGDALSFEYGDNLPAPKRRESGEYPVYGSNGIVGTHDTYLTKAPAIIVGRKGSAGALNIATGPSWTTDVAYFVQPPSDLDLRYTYYLLRSLRLDELGKGIKPGLSRKEAYVLPIALPPLAEQKRIVAKVDELMALCDRLEAQQQERQTRHAALARASLSRFVDAPTPANLSFLFHPSYDIAPGDARKAILALAVEGKLLPQNHTDEPADRFIALVRASRGKHSRVGKQLPERTHIEGPYEIPSSWSWTVLGNIADIGTGSTPARTEPSFWICGSIPWITSGSTSSSPILEADELVTQDAIKAHRLRIYPKGTLLVALYGQGKTRGQVAVLGITATINQACAAICSIEGIPSIQDYLKLLLEKQYDEMRLLSAGGAQPNLNIQKIKELLVPLPPLAEQRRIVAKVEQLMALVDQLEAQLTESKAKASKLLDAVIHELLNPRAEIIEFPRNRQNRVWDRAAIGCHIIQRMAGNPRFGKVMLMKLFYLSETHLDRSFGGTYKRHAAGPWDPWIDQFESLGQEQNWFSVIRHDIGDGHIKFEYRAEAGLGARAAEAAALLGDQQPEFDRVLGLFADKTFEQAEIIATLFAAWNDALIDGLQPSDDEIIREVRERWHCEKARFTPAQLQQWLAWMRTQKLVPKGLGRRTVQQTQLPLH